MLNVVRLLTRLLLSSFSPMWIRHSWVTLWVRKFLYSRVHCDLKIMDHGRGLAASCNLCSLKVESLNSFLVVLHNAGMGLAASCSLACRMNGQIIIIVTKIKSREVGKAASKLSVLEPTSNSERLQITWGYGFRKVECRTDSINALNLFQGHGNKFLQYA
ncbi:hypothetical protein VNO77_21887 [Canavalia gladiata]|uniref:Uncharacterized protein n=1 Tax=Canavalia gladiata TaxID=3824 RepID=A0AAN9L2G6_CANGL